MDQHSTNQEGIYQAKPGETLWKTPREKEETQQHVSLLLLPYYLHKNALHITGHHNKTNNLAYSPFKTMPRIIGL